MMSALWLVSYVVLWVLVIGGGLVILALAREIESLHTRLDSIQEYLCRTDWGVKVTDKLPSKQQPGIED